MQKIGISTVLNQFDLVYDEATTQVRTYGIRFVTALGIVREIYDARKNVKGIRQGTTGNPSPRSKQKYNLKAHGTMKLYDDNAEDWRDVKVAHMIAFRPHNSKTFIPIFH